MSFHAESIRDARSLPILAKSIYRELRHAGFDERHVMTLAGELLGLIANDVQSKRGETE